MAAKINKDMLLKNRFWILLGVTVVLSIVGLVWLQAANADDLLADVKKDLDQTKANAKSTLPGRDSIDAIAKQAEIAKDTEAKVWQDAYREQAKIFRWSDEIEAKFEFSDGKFANEIAVAKVAEREAWPDDPTGGVLGTLQSINDDFLMLKDRNKKDVKVYRTKNVKITTADDKAILWETNLAAYRNKLLEVKFQTGKIFNDALRGEEQETFKDSYLNQVDQILKTVEPLDEKGNGTVQLKNWLYNPDWVERFRTDRKPDDAMKFIRFVTIPWDTEKNFSEEAWIAQENIWIQREIYRIIRGANDEIKVFQGKGGAKKADTTYTFTNSYFQVELALSPDDSLSFTIRNLQSRRQKLDLSFRVLMNDGVGAKPEIINVSGPPLMPRGAKTNAAGEKDWETVTIPFARDGKDSPRKGIYRVEQMLTWETAAVKRIDHITIGNLDGTEIAHSHRTFPDGLRPLIERKEAPVEEKRPGDMKMPGGGPPPVGGIGGIPGAGGALGAGGNAGQLAHGLWKDRYSEVSEQSRRIPVAVSLIVDQDNVDRVLTAFNNSKLRFLESQVLVNHYSLSLQPPLPEDKEGFPGAPPMFPGGGRPEGGVRPPPAFGSPPMPGMPPGGPGMGPPTGGSSDLETNMEVVIYGFMTLYQRYPPPPAAKKE